MRSIRWTVGTGLLPTALIGGTVAVTLAWRSRLPESLPNSGGVGDRPVVATIGVDTLAGVLLGAALAVWAVGLLVFASTRRHSGAGRHWLRLGAQVAVNAFAAAAATALLMLFAAALDAPTAADVRLSWSYLVAVTVLPMVAAVLFGLLAYLLAGTAPPASAGGGPAVPAPAAVAGPGAPERAAEAGPVLAAGADERLVWWEIRPLRLMLWTIGALALTGVLMAAVLVPLVGVTGWAGAAPTVTALAMLPFTSYRLTIDGEAVRVAVGPLRRRVPISAIAAAEPDHLALEDWLLRSIVRGANAPDVPLLPGPALALRLTDGSRRLVTCRDVPTAVAMVNTLRARRA
ncbi:hypothetical protein [Plantactinospora endophytica]|uniref:DUF1648 domain-containing protein n=1 Tax=Plantactinospora endophytica TaxID=673535 RepID=A0ABQ4DVG9_9ACTN|nr:hypothetical protein [Plantactinospora endophytica]GIG86440.1 hypothetical protein Pen02_13760 [Plantactinospora endophytica]